jgi:ubiquinone/menaquinone biosynthesis C-methylase UbiE
VKVFWEISPRNPVSNKKTIDTLAILWQFNPSDIMAKHSADLTTKIVNGLLAIDPIANLLKQQARSMMIKRAKTIGVFWHETAEALRWRHEIPGNLDSSGFAVAQAWETTLAEIQNNDLPYPEYYLRPFHAYAEGNLGWLPAMEVEVAAKAVHARIWPDAGAQGDAWLRQSYHAVLQAQLAPAPERIIDLGCSVGMSTFSLQSVYPAAQVTGVDLSPYFLAVAQYQAQEYQAQQDSPSIQWVHAPAEATGLPDQSFDLVSACLVFHELPQSAALAILQEAKRLLKPGGHMALMDMNPQSDTFAKMPPYVFTLLKSTEPYLDEYFDLDLPQALQSAGFDRPSVTANSPRHRTLLARSLD